VCMCVYVCVCVSVLNRHRVRFLGEAPGGCRGRVANNGVALSHCCCCCWTPPSRPPQHADDSTFHALSTGCVPYTKQLPDPPAPPVGCNPSFSSILVRWEPPANPGDYPIIGYRLLRRAGLNSSMGWGKEMEVTGSKLEVRVDEAIDEATSPQFVALWWLVEVMVQCPCCLRRWYSFLCWWLVVVTTLGAAVTLPVSCSISYLAVQLELRCTLPLRPAAMMRAGPPCRLALPCVGVCCQLGGDDRAEFWDRV
jgi:hypothetical protein